MYFVFTPGGGYIPKIDYKANILFLSQFKNFQTQIIPKDQFTDLNRISVIILQIIQFLFTCYLANKTLKKFKKIWKKNVDKVFFNHCNNILFLFKKTPYNIALKNNCFSYYLLNADVGTELNVQT